MNWDEVIADPEFDKLSPAGQAYTRDRWFKLEVLPALQEAKISDAAIGETYKKAISEYDNGQGYIASFLGATAQGALGTISSGIQGVGALLDAPGIESIGTSMQSGVENTFTVNPSMTKTNFVGNVVGNVGAMMATGAVGGIAGRALGAVRLAEGATVAEQAAAALAQSGSATLGAEVGSLGSGFLAGAGQGAQEADQYGITGGDRQLRAFLGGAAEVISEKLPFGQGLELRAISKIPGVGNLVINKKTGGFIKDMLAEGGEELFAQGVGNLSTSLLAPAGTEGPDFTKDMPSSFIGGLIGGGLMGGVNLIGGREAPSVRASTIATQAGDTAAADVLANVGRLTSIVEPNAGFDIPSDQTSNQLLNENSISSPKTYEIAPPTDAERAAAAAAGVPASALPPAAEMAAPPAAEMAAPPAAEITASPIAGVVPTEMATQPPVAGVVPAAEMAAPPAAEMAAPPAAEMAAPPAAEMAAPPAAEMAAPPAAEMAAPPAAEMAAPPAAEIVAPEPAVPAVPAAVSKKAEEVLPTPPATPEQLREESKLIDQNGRITNETGVKIVAALTQLGVANVDVVFNDTGKPPDSRVPWTARGGRYTVNGKDVVYLNRNLMTADTPVHEVLGHGVIEQLDKLNPDLDAQARAILTGSPLEAAIKARYARGGLELDSEALFREAKATLIGNQGAKVFEDYASSGEFVRALKQWVAKFQTWLDNHLSSKGVDPNMSLEDFAKKVNRLVIAGKLQTNTKSAATFSESLLKTLPEKAQAAWTTKELAAADKYSESGNRADLAGLNPIKVKRVMEHKRNLAEPNGPQFSLAPQDAEYMAAVKSGDVAKQQEMVDEAAKAAGYDLAHRGKSPELSTFIVQFADIEEAHNGISSYGRNLWYAKSSDLGDASNPGQDVENWIAENYPDYNINPSNIINSAEAWDDLQFVSDIWQAGAEFGSWLNEAGYRTSDGAVVFPASGVAVSGNPITYDDNGNVIPLSQRFNPTVTDTRYSLAPTQQEDNQPPKDGFYSAAVRLIEQKMGARAPRNQIVALLTNQQSGVKADELKWTGVVPWLSAQPEPVSKEAVLEFLRGEGNVQFEEISLGDTKYEQYQLPGGENYREVVLAMPEGPLRKPVAGEITSKTAGYTSSHFPNVPNYVAHMRTNERTDADGNPGLFIEEIQSDRHQDGRKKGYKLTPEESAEIEQLTAKAKANGGVANFNEVDSTRWKELGAKYENNDSAIADAPFRTTWPLAMFKRALRDAVASGKTWIGWTVGETQNDRFDLAKQVDSLNIRKQQDGLWSVVGIKGGSEVVSETRLSDAKLADTIGKELAERAITDMPGMGYRVYSGEDLKMGGSGMRGFYDNILPKEVGKYVGQKGWNGKVEKSAISAILGMEVGSPTINIVNNDGKILTTYDQPDPITRRELAQKWLEYNRISYPNARLEESVNAQPIWRVAITPSMTQSITNEGQARYSLQPSGLAFNQPGTKMNEMAASFNVEGENGADALDQAAKFYDPELPFRDHLAKLNELIASAGTKGIYNLTPFSYAGLVGDGLNNVINNENAPESDRASAEYDLKELAKVVAVVGTKLGQLVKGIDFFHRLCNSPLTQVTLDEQLIPFDGNQKSRDEFDKDAGIITSELDSLTQTAITNAPANVIENPLNTALAEVLRGGDVVDSGLVEIQAKDSQISEQEMPDWFVRAMTQEDAAMRLDTEALLKEYYFLDLLTSEGSFSLSEGQMMSNKFRDEALKMLAEAKASGKSKATILEEAKQRREALLKKLKTKPKAVTEQKPAAEEDVTAMAVDRAIQLLNQLTSVKAKPKQESVNSMIAKAVTDSIFSKVGLRPPPSGTADSMATTVGLLLSNQSIAASLVQDVMDRLQADPATADMITLPKLKAFFQATIGKEFVSVDGTTESSAPYGQKQIANLLRAELKTAGINLNSVVMDAVSNRDTADKLEAQLRDPKRSFAKILDPLSLDKMVAAVLSEYKLTARQRVERLAQEWVEKSLKSRLKGPQDLSKANQSILANFRTQMRQQGGETLARNFWQLMSNTPRQQPGALASFDSATQTMLADLLKRAVTKAGLAGNTTSIQPDAIQKLVLNLSNDNLRWEKIAAADEAVQAEIDAIKDDTRREAVRAAWESATSDMSFAIGGPALLRRALRDQMKDSPPNWKAAFDTGKPILEAVANDRVTFVNAAMVKIQNALTTKEGLAKIPALRAEMEVVFNDIAIERYESWLQGRERTANQQKTATARADFMAALRNRGVAEARLNKLAEALSDTPTYTKSGEVNPITSLINSQMKQADPDFVAKMAALGVTADVASPLKSAIEENRRRAANVEAAIALEKSKAKEEKLAAQKAQQQIKAAMAAQNAEIRKDQQYRARLNREARRNARKEGQAVPVTRAELEELMSKPTTKVIDFLAREYGFNLSGLTTIAREADRYATLEQMMLALADNLGLTKAQTESLMKPVIAEAMKTVDAKRKALAKKRIQDAVTRIAGKTKKDIPTEAQKLIRLAELGGLTEDNVETLLLATKDAKKLSPEFKKMLINLVTEANDVNLPKASQDSKKALYLSYIKSVRGISFIGLLGEWVMSNIFMSSNTFKVNAIWGAAKVVFDSTAYVLRLDPFNMQPETQLPLGAKLAMGRQFLRAFNSDLQYNAKYIFGTGMSNLESDMTTQFSTSLFELLDKIPETEIKAWINGKPISPMWAGAVKKLAKFSKYTRRIMVATDIANRTPAYEMLKVEAIVKFIRERGTNVPSNAREWQMQIDNALYGGDFKKARDTAWQKTNDIIVSGRASEQERGLIFGEEMDKMLAENLKLTPTQLSEMLDRAQDTAKRWTVANATEGILGSVSNSMLNMVRNVPGLQFLLPAIRMPIGAFSQGLDWTPYGFFRYKTIKSSGFKTASVSNWMMNKGGSKNWNQPAAGIPSEQAIDTLNKAAIGTTMMIAMAIALALSYDDDEDKAAFYITGRGPEDPQKNKLWREKGNRRGMGRINGVSFNYLESPIAPMLTVLGAISDAVRYGKPEDATSDKIFYALTKVISGFSDAAVLKSFQDAMAVVSGGSGYTSSSAAETAARTFGRTLGVSVAPRLLGEINTILYGEQDLKEGGWAARILANVPFVPAAMDYPALNWFGEQIHADRGPGGELLTLAYSRVSPTLTDDEQMRFVARIGANKLTTTRRTIDGHEVMDQPDLVHQWAKGSGIAVRKWLTPERIAYYETMRQKDVKAAEEAFDKEVRKIRENELRRIPKVVF